MSDHLKVVPINEGRPPLNDVPGRLRLLADQIEAGEHGKVDAALVLAPVADDYPLAFGFGDLVGQSDPIITCELAKAWFVNNLVRRT